MNNTIKELMDRKSVRVFTEPERIKPERHALSDIVCENGYVRKDGAGLRSMFAKNCKMKSYEEWADAFCSRKYNSDFSKEMSRSVAEYLKQFQ